MEFQSKLHRYGKGSGRFLVQRNKVSQFQEEYLDTKDRSLYTGHLEVNNGSGNGTSQKLVRKTLHSVMISHLICLLINFLSYPLLPSQQQFSSPPPSPTERIKLTLQLNIIHLETMKMNISITFRQPSLVKVQQITVSDKIISQSGSYAYVNICIMYLIYI